jgi:hypothetical protein
VLNLEELTDKTKTRAGSSRAKGANVPDVHVHNYFGETALHPHFNTNNTSHGTANTSISHPKRKRDSTPESDDESDLEPIHIENMLQTLHTLMPSFNFPQYQEPLLSKGICYGRSVVDFNQSYYVDKVGMTDGAAAEFVRSASRMLGKQKKEKEQEKGREKGKEREKKKRRVGKENHPIRLETPEL